MNEDEMLKEIQNAEVVKESHEISSKFQGMTIKRREIHQMMGADAQRLIDEAVMFFKNEVLPVNRKYVNGLKKDKKRAKKVEEQQKWAVERLCRKAGIKNWEEHFAHFMAGFYKYQYSSFNDYLKQEDVLNEV